MRKGIQIWAMGNGGGVSVTSSVNEGGFVKWREGMGR